MQSASKMYAAALLEIGTEDGTSRQIFDDLKTVGGVIDGCGELEDLLVSPAFSAEEKTGVIESLFSGKISPTVYNTLCVLTEKRRMAIFSQIVKDYKDAYYDKCGIAEADVTTVAPMKAETRDRLKAKLEKLYNKKIIINAHTDPSVIGGVRVVCCGNMLDGTVRTRLHGMKDKIKENISI